MTTTTDALDELRESGSGSEALRDKLLATPVSDWRFTTEESQEILAAVWARPRLEEQILGWQNLNKLETALLRRLRSLNRLQCATALFFCATYGILFAIEGRTLHASLAAIWTGLAALWAWRSYVVDGQVRHREDLERGPK